MKNSSDHFVFCIPTLDLYCEFGKVEIVTASCECGRSVIVSEATFIATSISARTLICSDGIQEEVSIVPRGINRIIIVEQALGSETLTVCIDFF